MFWDFERPEILMCFTKLLHFAIRRSGYPPSFHSQNLSMIAAPTV